MRYRIASCMAFSVSTVAKQACEPAACLLQGPQGLDNLLYSADADFSCFADLAVTSPVEYYREGQGSLLQCVLTPADSYMPLPNEAIAAKVHEQVGLAFLVTLLCIFMQPCWIESESFSVDAGIAW